MIPIITWEKAGWTFLTSHPCLRKKWKLRHIKAKLWVPSPAARPATPQCRPHRSPVGDGPLPVTGRARAVLLPYRPGVGVTQLLILRAADVPGHHTALPTLGSALWRQGEGAGGVCDTGVATSISQAQLPSSSRLPARSRRHSPRTTPTSPTGARRRGSGRSCVPRAARPRLPHTGRCTPSCRSRARASSSSARRGTGSPLRRCANTRSSCSSPTCPRSGWPSMIPPVAAGTPCNPHPQRQRGSSLPPLCGPKPHTTS